MAAGRLTLDSYVNSAQNDPMKLIILRGYPTTVTFPGTVPPGAEAVLYFSTDSNAGQFPLNTADGFMRLSLTATQTAALAPGEGWWEVSTETGIACAGRLDIGRSVKQDGEQAVQKTVNERILAAAEGVLETAAAGGETSMSVDGTSYSWESREELLNFISRMRILVQAERGELKNRVRFKTRRIWRTW